jgi:plastocyanin
MELSTMKSLIGRLRAAAAALAISRAVILALLLGPIAGAALALGAHAAQEDNVVTIDNFTFAPVPLTIAVGTTVKWVNRDDIPHTVVENNKTFRSKALDTDDSYTYTFATAGTFDYFCSLHPHMVGKVIVK